MPKVTRKNKKSKLRVVRAGLDFPVGRVRRLLRNGNYADRIGASASVYFTAVLRYLTAEVLQLAGNEARNNKENRISARHIQSAIRNNDELNELLSNVTLSEGGVLPNTNSALLPNLLAERASNSDKIDSNANISSALPPMSPAKKASNTDKIDSNAT
ncbi:unnamed protein product [Cercopithifilaria johnstoni]|uniref:Histone H2A n=1 Tax=Cercopithifilaria johnstoni TaxID=2874296 RepID=A0A8J2LVR1_9BILA|nr:unnamed protein product [Cercopithifilaria johnstoni]